MERRMTEEQVTKAIIRWLVAAGWEILSFDYPQSGTGRALHPVGSLAKTDGSIIPDIIAHKSHRLIFFEDKSQYTHSDFEKIERLRHTDAYNYAIAELAGQRIYTQTYFGIGFQSESSQVGKSCKDWTMADFLVTVSADGCVTPQYDPHHLF